MKRIFVHLTSQKPLAYGVLYLCLIPIFALIYAYCPEATLKLNGHVSGPVTNLYFSVITITTLGYGDITPTGTLSQCLAAIESVLGIILIGLFLNSLSHQHGVSVQNHEKEEQSKRDLKSAIDRFVAFNKLIELNIQLYCAYTIPITTPIENRDKVGLNVNFAFNDMYDLFKTTLRLTDCSHVPAISYYFKHLNALKNSLEELVKLAYLERWPDIENLCLNFISKCKEYDFSDYILNQPKMMIGDEKATDFDADMIKNYEGEVEFHKSNAMNAYVALYLLINESFVFVEKYSMLSDDIKKKISSLLTLLGQNEALLWRIFKSLFVKFVQGLKNIKKQYKFFIMKN